MKAVPAFISRNFWLKCLALVLAVVVYYVLRDAAATSKYGAPSLMKGAADAEQAG